MQENVNGLIHCNSLCYKLFQRSTCYITESKWCLYTVPSSQQDEICQLKSPLLPNSKFYTYNCFKQNPNEQTFSHYRLPDLHTWRNYAQHLLTIDQMKTSVIKTKATAALLSSLTQRLHTRLLSNVHQDTLKSLPDTFLP